MSEEKKRNLKEQKTKDQKDYQVQKKQEVGKCVIEKQEMCRTAQLLSCSQPKTSIKLPLKQ